MKILLLLLLTGCGYDHYRADPSYVCLSNGNQTLCGRTMEQTVMEDAQNSLEMQGNYREGIKDDVSYHWVYK